jgi:hypothetical protein
MKHFRITLIIVSLFALAAVVLSACGPAATPGPVTLTVSGMVGAPLNLTDADLHAMKKATVTADQPKVGSQTFTGVHLSDLLAKAQVQSGAANLVFSASDNYSAQIDVATVNGCTDCMVAFTNTAGSYLLVMPNQAGKLWVKNLIKIEVK